MRMYSCFKFVNVVLAASARTASEAHCRGPSIWVRRVRITHRHRPADHLIAADICRRADWLDKVPGSGAKTLKPYRRKSIQGVTGKLQRAPSSAVCALLAPIRPIAVGLEPPFTLYVLFEDLKQDGI